MPTNKRRRAVFDVNLIVSDMTDRGWIDVDLANALRVSKATVSRFLGGQHQSPRLAARVAHLFGREVAYYKVTDRRAAAVVAS